LAPEFRVDSSRITRIFAIEIEATREFASAPNGAHQDTSLRGTLKRELRRRVPHSRVGVKALADLSVTGSPEAGHAETLASVFGLKKPVAGPESGEKGG